MADNTQGREVKLRWLGTHTIIGVPARDLSEAEADRHKEAIAAAEKAHGFRLYEPAAPPAVEPAQLPRSEKAGKKE